MTAAITPSARYVPPAVTARTPVVAVLTASFVPCAHFEK
jgi:hypothetical protein